MKKVIALLMSAILLVSLLTACGTTEDKPKDTATTTVSTTTTTTTADTTTTTGESTTGTTADTTTGTSVESTTATTTTTTKVTTTTTTVVTTPKVAAKLNGVSLSDYVIVYDDQALDYTERAATYIHDEILARTGANLEVVKDSRADPAAHEIVVGETDRAISKALNEKTEGLEFSMVAKDGHVAMEGDYFIIAAAAYYFVTTYITGKSASTTVPTKALVREPIVEKANNFFFLIGDGMGENQTMLPQGYNKENMYTDEGTTDFTDGEDFFYGHLFPNAGYAMTNSLSGTTDSAAGGTALATGYKTINGYIGKDKNLNNVKSLTELAGELGMATAVMTTEGIAGATPGGFSAHQDFRDMYDEIKADQAKMTEKYGTIFHSHYDNYNRMGMWSIDTDLDKTLKSLSQNDKGIFMMYEEAYIDKHCHNQDEEKATWAVFRFNQAIARFMEFAFYHPDTMVIITADHETGSLTKMGNKYYCANGDHSSRNVPVYAYGVGTEVFNGVTIENVQIPKTIAKMWGQSLAADTDSQYPPLI